ncbi:hypothetical protein PIB30_053914 [Stylosanthes scabra]|uniref:Uncharacterized protein n=1 Tax=Stylosanthes scabra TaxID=79078 RepID=A0ABU6ZHD5_9FABA|nr:hypothetical protein [Stylosanthes scabra]
MAILLVTRVSFRFLANTACNSQQPNPMFYTYGNHTAFLLFFTFPGQNRSGSDKLRVAANGTSIGVPDQKLSHPKGGATYEWHCCNFAVWFIPVQIFSEGFGFRRSPNWLSTPFRLKKSTESEYLSEIPKFQGPRFTFHPPYLEFCPRNSNSIVTQFAFQERLLTSLT